MTALFLVFGLLGSAASFAQAPEAPDALSAVLSAMGRVAPLRAGTFRAMIDARTKIGSGWSIGVPGLGAQAVGAADLAVLSAIADLPRPVIAVDVRPGRHAALIDLRGGVYVIDLSRPDRRVSALKGPVTSPERAELDKTYRDMRWYVIHGWSPPRTERQALLMGVIRLPDGVLQDPPTQWLAAVPVQGESAAPSDCSYYTQRNGGTARLYSVCRSGKTFQHRELMRTELGRLFASPRGRYVAYETEEEIGIAAGMGGPAVSIKGRAPFGWLDDHILMMSDQNGERREGGGEMAVRLVDASNGRSLALKSCSGDAIAIEQVEFGTAGRPPQFLLMNGEAVQWNASRLCAG